MGKLSAKGGGGAVGGKQQFRHLIVEFKGFFAAFVWWFVVVFVAVVKNVDAVSLVVFTLDHDAN